MKKGLFFVFDVESVGLHGEGFAVAATVVDLNGECKAQMCAACEPAFVRGEASDLDWVKKNVTLPYHYERCNSPERVRAVFWAFWQSAQERGAVMATDCGWPVEANFLSACIAQDPEYAKDAPYPLFDLSSVLLMAGKDPIGTFERLPDELPAHNPLCDARQSARVLIETLEGVEA